MKNNSIQKAMMVNMTTFREDISTKKNTSQEVCQVLMFYFTFHQVICVNIFSVPLPVVTHMGIN